MSSIETKFNVIRVKYLISRFKSIKTYNLSGSGWQDYASASERSSLYEYNKDAERKRFELSTKIVGYLFELEKDGYPIETILSKYKPSQIEDIKDLYNRKKAEKEETNTQGSR